MSGLKLTIVASIYSKPYNLDKWVRTLATTTNITPRPKPSTSFYTHTDRTPVSCTPVLRITPYAPLAPYSKLGFRGQKIFYSSEDNKGVVEGGSSGLATDMGTESKDDYCYDSDRSPPSHNHHHPPPPPQQQHKKEQHQQSTKLLTLPTILTIGRVATVPLLVGTFYVDSWWGTTATTSIFIAAAFTDWLDGYIARKMRLGSAFGAFLDPVADKITMSAVREWAASQNTQLLEAVAVNNLGKWKTASQMAALTILLATRDNSLTGAGVVVASGVSLLYVSAGLAVWSLVVYMRKIWKVLLK
ncbi:CDP-diacylglycerol--glycerol-3-phosphate 3-phosphatidyltransferase 2 isoform X2 [Cornus florida]|uniref:CDP-diacylglycerol--glycerol-3-phosphate 3-phosphatidyltransferase 2 isoform X2 n=1 Tax=Cornus florida TaxID=4283 RepID=UPI002898FAAC|nr:CDP-diacylglycerol--glycerol-3-phosphate 3-phosphatidyltransferase 2 isoform X2 [Cornus florida]